MIIISDLTIAFEKKTIIESFSLEVSKGEKVTFMGPSGSGKTSILTTLLGFNPAKHGQIIINQLNLNPRNIRAIRKLTAWVPQELAFDLPLARDLLLFPFQFKSNKKKLPSENDIRKTLEAMNLDYGLLEQPLKKISGGEKQRLSLAAGILQKKTILLLDEPTSALDSQTRKKVSDYIQSLEEVTVIAASHDEYWIEHSGKVIDLQKK